MIQEGIRHASDGELLLAIERLHDECFEHSITSPRYRAAIRWLSSTRKELRRRSQADWSVNPPQRDYGDEG